MTKHTENQIAVSIGYFSIGLVDLFDCTVDVEFVRISPGNGLITIPTPLTSVRMLARLMLPGFLLVGGFLTTSPERDSMEPTGTNRIPNDVVDKR